ncbi:MAG: cupredoxin domain-containing protein [Acidimicrobiales bacterium]
MASPDQTAPYAAGPQQERLGGSWFLILTLGGLAIVMAFMLGIAAIGILAGDGGGAQAPRRPPASMSRWPNSPSTATWSPPKARSPWSSRTTARWITTSASASSGCCRRTSAPAAWWSWPWAKLNPGTYEVYCDIAGHADSGMVAVLTVSGAARPSPPQARAVAPTIRT